MALLTEILQLVTQLGQGRVVAGGEAGQRHLLIPGAVAALHGVLGAQGLAAVADRAVHIPRLTEPAAPDAAPEQLQHHPILHDLRGGDNGLSGEKGLVHIVDDTLGDHRRSALQRRDLRHGAVVMIRHLVQAGDVDARQLGRRTEKLHLAPALPAGLAVQLH